MILDSSRSRGVVRVAWARVATASLAVFALVAVLSGTGDCQIPIAPEKVLIAGGCCDSSGALLRSAELYDPFQGRFRLTGAIKQGRTEHSATLLQGNLILIAGGAGVSSKALDTAELYNVTSGTFTATGNMTVARRAHTASLLADGRVLIAGGIDADGRVLDSAELYNPSSGKFAATGSMTAERAFHTATVFTSGPLSGEVLIAGGAGANETAVNSAELYDAAGGNFITTGAMVHARAAHTASLLSDGDVLVAGGGSVAPPEIAGTTATAEVYHAGKGLFTAVGNMTTAREEHTATLVTAPLPVAAAVGGTVLIAGGISCPGPPEACATLPIAILASAELYDSNSGKFTRTGSMAEPRAQHSATQLADGLALVAGGIVTSPGHSAELYDLPIRRFMATGAMVHPRYGHTATDFNPCPLCVAPK